MSSFYNSDILSSKLSFSWNVVISLRIMNNLGLNRNILNSFIYFLNRFINHDSLLNFSFNVLYLSFNCIIVSYSSLNRDTFVSDNFFILCHLNFNWHLINLFNLFIFNIFLFERDVLNSALYWNFFSNSFVSCTRNSISTDSLSCGGCVVLLGSTRCSSVVLTSSSGGNLT